MRLPGPSTGPFARTVRFCEARSGSGALAWTHAEMVNAAPGTPPGFKSSSALGCAPAFSSTTPGVYQVSAAPPENEIGVSLRLRDRIGVLRGDHLRDEAVVIVRDDAGRLPVKGALAHDDLVGRGGAPAPAP